MKTFRAGDSAIQSDLLRYVEQGGLITHSFGFTCWDEVIKLCKGYPLFIAGEPFSGKTEVLLEIMVTCAEIYGWKSFVYLGESGKGRDIVAELCHKYTGKPYTQLTLAEQTGACAWVDKHFHFVDPEAVLTIDEFYTELESVQINRELTFDMSAIDPFNDLEDIEYDARYLNKCLKIVCRESYRTNRIDILVNHIGETHKELNRKSKKRYKMPALADEWAGGKMWFRRAFTMLLVYRPPAWMEDAEGQKLFMENQTQIIVQKAKPKGVGKLGTIDLFHNSAISRFLEMDSMGYENKSRKL